MSKYNVKITGKQIEVNAHNFEGTFGFDNKDQADAFADFKLSSMLLEPELVDIKVERLYD